MRALFCAKRAKKAQKSSKKVLTRIGGCGIINKPSGEREKNNLPEAAMILENRTV
jgi:hypothetical protein